MECNEREKVALKDKYLLTVKEAAEYFGIGEKKLRSIAEQHRDDGLVVQNGVKLLIKRNRFEDFLNETSTI